MVELKVMFVVSFVGSLLCGLFAEDEEGTALAMHRGLLVLTVVFGFLLTWGM